MNWLYGFVCLVLLACGDGAEAPLENAAVVGESEETLAPEPPADDAPDGSAEEVVAPRADIVAVVASGSSGTYAFSVTVSSPDTGCEEFADWWEVLSEDGQLLYRRVLLHSHVGEQPFARSGGPVAAAAEQIVWVRAHMSVGGYGGAAFRGSVSSGFAAAELAADFAAELVEQEPLPQGCAF